LGKKLDERDLEDLRLAVDTPECVRLLSRIMDYCGVFISSYSNDISVMSFNEGRRDVGLMILGLLKSIHEGDSKLRSATKYRESLYDSDIKEDKHGNKKDAITGRHRYGGQ